MKKILTLLGLTISSLSSAFGAPDFAEYGFTSELPTEISWTEKLKSDDHAGGIFMRGYASAEGARSVSVIVAKSTDEKDLEKFSISFAKRLAEKPGLKITMAKNGTMGGLPAKLFTVEMQLAKGIHHMLSIVALQGETVYTCTLGSNIQRVEADGVLMAYYRSIQIARK